MRICILVAGRLNSTGKSELPEFPLLIASLLNAWDYNEKIKLSHMSVLEGIFPKNVGDFDGYLITGSSFSVYEDLPWIHRLMDFIQSAFTQNVPQAGICFGHQILAQALGGRVEQTARGWGVGLRRTRIISRTPWMDQGPPSSLDLLYIHKDQVTKLPPNAQQIMGDDFCPFGGFFIGNSIFAIQAHPELTPKICRTVLSRRSDLIGPARVQAAIKTLESPHHGLRIAKWLVDFFLKQAGAKYLPHL